MPAICVHGVAVRSEPVDLVGPDRGAIPVAHDTVKRCILRLYRSAVTVGAEWPLERPAEVAEQLTLHWEGLGQ